MDTFEIIGELLSEILLYAVIFSIPAASLIWLIVSVVRYLKAPKSDKELCKKRRIPLIISAVAYPVTLLFLKIQTTFLRNSLRGKIINPRETIYDYIYNDLNTITLYTLILSLLFSILSASLIWLIVSVIEYLTASKSDKELCKKRRLSLIISAIVFAVLLFATLVITILFIISLSHM